MSLVRPSNALISVSDKTGLQDLAQTLSKFNIALISTGGTFKQLQSFNTDVIEVATYTQSPEILDGRVKTLHPKIHGGLLGNLALEQHRLEMEKQGIAPIDLIIVNLYPFEQTLLQNPTELEAIEKIDIGGPSMIRSAAKNHARVTVITDPDQYDVLAKELEDNDGSISQSFRQACALKAFEQTALYDSAIARFFQKDQHRFPKNFPMGLKAKQTLRYGENPHQKAAFTTLGSLNQSSLIDTQLQGKPLSYNNIIDVHAAIDLMGDVAGGPTVGIFKHTNPCGVGRGSNLKQAYMLALACDSTSAFGGIVIFSDPVDIDAAKACTQIFTEIVIAPSFTDEALNVFVKKKNLRVLKIDPSKVIDKLQPLEIKRALDGYLVQEADGTIEDVRTCNVATQRVPTEQEWEALDFAWRVCKHVKSNAIVICNQHQTLGIGAGQMSRVDATQIALSKIEKETSKARALGSDAFFPFRDSIDLIAKNGVTCIVQPGGSIRDQEVINAANQHDLAMVLTGVRHFKH